jgi:hypothetical protein
MWSLKIMMSWVLVITLVILPTQKAEIRRIVVQSQPWTVSSGDPMLKISNTKKELAE